MTCMARGTTLVLGRLFGFTVQLGGRCPKLDSLLVGPCQILEKLGSKCRLSRGTKWHFLVIGWHHIKALQHRRSAKYFLHISLSLQVVQMG